MAADASNPRRGAGTDPQGVESVPPPLLVVGGISTDHVTAASGASVRTLGGAGLYAALGAAAVDSVPVRLAGVVGADIAATAHDHLRRARVEPAMTVVSGAGLRFVIRYDADWRAHYTLDGAEADSVVTYPLVASACPDPAAVHLCPTGSPTVQLELAAALRAAHGPGLWLSATTFAARIRSHPGSVHALWNLVDVLVCDLHEIQLLTGHDAPTKALRTAEELTGPRVTCVTDAHRGSYLIADGAIVPIAAYQTDTVDPTGAGESFAGAFTAARLAGHGLLASSTIAAATASLTVEDFGIGQLVEADHAEVQRRAATVAGRFLAERGHHG